jgi:DNA mismatch repair protein MutL
MSCHAAVRAGHPLTPEEAVHLLELLDGTPFHAQCPHGRPVAVRFDVARLEALFGRTYEGTPRAAGREKFER